MKKEKVILSGIFSIIVMVFAFSVPLFSQDNSNNNIEDIIKLLIKNEMQDMQKDLESLEDEVATLAKEKKHLEQTIQSQTTEIEKLKKLLESQKEFRFQESKWKSVAQGWAYQQMEDNWVELTPGTWRLFGTVNFDNSKVRGCGIIWSTENGSDLHPSKKPIPAISCDAGLSYATLLNSTLGADWGYNVVVPPIRFTIEKPTKVYLVPYTVIQGDASLVTKVQTMIYAERLP